MFSLTNKVIAVLGLGYVGLPLALEFARYYPVIGYDIDNTRISELNYGQDRTSEADIEKLLDCLTLAKKTNFKKGIIFSSEVSVLHKACIFVVTVPTPIDKFNCPDLVPLLNAAKIIGTVLKPGDLVIFESTVYPGCTEEECVPILEYESGLKFNIDFYCGYSPERINPGDKIHTLSNTVKVTSGSTPEIAKSVDKLYGTIITAGTYLAPSIKVAEASKAIENAQRDVNISFINELSLIFDKMKIDTNDVLDAAGTKYNFLKFKPGLVGGHCISVDPYYLAHKSILLGYHPNVILSGRKVNDMLPVFIADKVVKLMIYKGLKIMNKRVLILGITFKENCPDIRNSKVIDIYLKLAEFGLKVDIYDPLADPNDVWRIYGVDLLKEIDYSIKYKAVILAVAHNHFISFDYLRFKENGAVIFDAKALWERDLVDGRL